MFSDKGYRDKNNQNTTSCGNGNIAVRSGMRNAIEIAKRCMRVGAICTLVTMAAINPAYGTSAALNPTTYNKNGWIDSPYGFETKDEVHVKKFANAVEQVMGSLTVNSRELDYTLTARAQSDSSGYGTAYLLNGLSDKGYWFQIGISYNPAGMDAQGPLYIPGFQVVFNIFNPEKKSITIDSNVAGMLDFNNKIKDGDKVALRLYFDKGYVVMQVRDLRSNAKAMMGYDSNGAQTFVGTSLRSNPQGFFSGPMVERHTSINSGTRSLPKLNGILRVEFKPKTKTSQPIWVSTDVYTLNSGWVYSFQTPSPIAPCAASYGGSRFVDINPGIHNDVKVKFLDTPDRVQVKYYKDGVFEVGSDKK